MQAIESNGVTGVTEIQFRDPEFKVVIFFDVKYLKNVAR